MAKSKKQSRAAQENTAITDAPHRIVRANVNRETVAAEAFVSLYANDTQIQLSPWDVRIIFGVITEPPASERPSIQVKTIGEVRMSPQHAKRVAMILVQQLKVYEDTIGPIPQPD